MKLKLTAVAVLAGFLNLGAYGIGEQFEAPIGEFNFYAGGGGIEGSWIRYEAWTLGEIQSTTFDNLEFWLFPNSTLYDDQPAIGLFGDGDYIAPSDWRNNAGAGPLGNIWCEATTLMQQNPIQSDWSTVNFEFTVHTNTLLNTGHRTVTTCVQPSFVCVK